MFTQNDINNITSAVNGISENVDRITSATSDGEIDLALKNILDTFQGMGILPYLPILFLVGISIGLSLLLFVRVAYFFNFYYPSKGVLGSIFNYKFYTPKDVNFVRRVLKAVHEYEPPKTGSSSTYMLPDEPESNNYLRRRLDTKYRSNSGSAFGHGRVRSY